MKSKGDKKLLERIRVLSRHSSPSPHKVLLLKVLIDLIERDERHENKFQFEEIEPLFVSLLREVIPGQRDSYYLSALEYPFYYLQSDRFWKLKIKEGMLDKYREYEKTRLTKNRILETVDYGYFDEDVFTFLSTVDGRESIRAEINEWLSINKYAIPESREDEMVLDETSLFEHEQIAIDKLSKAIGSEMSLLPNVLIWDPQTNNYYEYDLIIVGRSGIYVVDLKHWSGVIETREYQWRRNKNEYRPDPHINNTFKCKILKGLYEHQFVTYP
ncbi:MAG TPA: NERD domain-containing protein, partial [Fervidobacterium sp.]|nr:NERD domain-containing protein [Fervidobacterium sp.]